MRFVTFLIKNLLRRKVRSLLTAFGFAVAVGATVALLGVSESFERAWEGSMIERGIDLIVADPNTVDDLSMSLEETYGPKIAAVPGVKDVTATLVDFLNYTDDEGFQLQTLVQGWETDSFLFDAVTLIEGRLFEEGDDHVAVVGKKRFENMNKQVGDKVELLGESFRIIGVYESFNVYENGAVTIPLNNLQSMLDREDTVTAFSVIVDDAIQDDEQQMEQVQAAIAALAPSNSAGRLEAKPTAEFVQSSLYIQLANAMAWMTSAIAVVVGSIGVLNTMVMSVIERIREIAVLRAIGWKKLRIVRMIIGEAIMLSLVGAALGTLGALVLVKWLTTLQISGGFIQGDIAPLVILKGFALALMVGVLGGAYPAWRAAQLLPSEGLRHE